MYVSCQVPSPHPPLTSSRTYKKGGGLTALQVTSAQFGFRKGELNALQMTSKVFRKKGGGCLVRKCAWRKNCY